MNSISKKKLKSLGLTNSNDIAVAAGKYKFIERQKSLGGPAWVIVESGTGEILHEVADETSRSEGFLQAIKSFEEGSWDTDYEKDPFGGWHLKGTLALAVGVKSGHTYELD